MEEIRSSKRYSKINEINDQDDQRLKEAARLLSPPQVSRAERVRADYFEWQRQDQPFDES